MIRDFFQSITAYFESISAISRYKLWPYVLFSAILSIIIGLLLYNTATGLGASIADRLLSNWEWGSTNDIVEFISGFLSKGVILLVFWFMFKYIMFVVLSPIMSLISEKIESIHDETEPVRFTIAGAISDMIRGLRIALRNIVRELFITGIILT